MKKLFFAICFNLVFIGFSEARVTAISGYENIPQPTQSNAEPIVRNVSLDEFKEILKKGFKDAPKVNEKTINKNVSHVPSALRLQAKQNKNKSFFQKVYEQAIERVSVPQNTQRPDIANQHSFSTTSTEKQQQDWNVKGTPVITAYIPPNNTPVMVPALEHIPYLMSSLEVLPSGIVKFEDTITVIANGEKLKNGLTRILPLKVFNTEGEAQTLDYSVIGVRVNDMPVDYLIISNGKNALMVPKNDYQLPPGVYTYKFEYLVDNLLWDYDSFYQLYWDVGGNGWNLVVDRLGASLNLPQKDALIEHNILLGNSYNLATNAVSIHPNGPTAMAYIASRPLFIGEGMHLIANISKNSFTPESFWQKINRHFYGYGEVYLSILGLIIITISFIISWHFIKNNKSQMKITLNKTSMIIRYLTTNNFDAKSVCGFILDLYKKNIIDIQQSDDTILLIKRTDNFKSLTSNEQKALKKLFPTHETIFNVNKQNKLPLRRFSTTLRSGLTRQMLKFKLKLNLGYLLFSLVMLFLTETSIALFEFNSWYVFKILCLASFLSLAGIIIFKLGRNIWIKSINKFISLVLLAFSFIIFSAVISPLAALILILSIVIITMFLTLYSQRMGLIKQYIQEAGNFKDYLLSNRDNIVKSRSFVNYQSAIWAFDLEDMFIKEPSCEYNKLMIAKNILKILSDK